MNTIPQTNIQQTLFNGDNELMKIDLYLDKQFGQGSIQAITLMADIAELKKISFISSQDNQIKSQRSG